MKDGLNYLLNKYSVPASAVISEDGGFVTIEGEKYPILPWESERRIIELYNMYKSERLGEACTYRIAHTAKAGTDLFDLLYREVGILTYTVDSPAKEVFAIAGERTMNCIVECECGTVATIELAATLDEGEEDIDKHEMICEIAVACDRVVDTQVPQHSVYLFGKEKAKYRDTDAELFGYTELQASVIRNAFRLASSEEYRAASLAKHEHILSVVAAAKKSLETLENVKVGC